MFVVLHAALGSQANSSIVRAKMEETVIYKPTMKCQQMADDMSVFTPNAEKEILRIRAESTEHDLLLQDVFSRMVEALTDVRARNLILKYITDYQQAEVYLNNPSLIERWHGAGRRSVDVILRFLFDFYQEYKTIASKTNEEVAIQLVSIEYPFLEEDEQRFVGSFLKSEGRYPVFFLATRYFQHTSERNAQIFARANGVMCSHLHYDALADEFGITRERVRQLSLIDLTSANDAGMLWDGYRWQSLGFLQKPVLTADNIQWKELAEKEHVEGIDFYAALAIIGQMVPLQTVALRADGRRANARLSANTPWEMPDVLFAYNSRYSFFSFENALIEVGHVASLQRITEDRMPLSGIISRGLVNRQMSDIDAVEIKAVEDILREVVTMFPHVAVEDDDIVFQVNRINYIEEIYQILRRKGEAMTINEIFAEFLRLHPDDHHTDSLFVRSYMLRDDRFEAVGSKSTYQLKEWNRFAGSLGDLAVHLVENSPEPVRADILCQRMMEHRHNTTMKSCYTSIYLAINAKQLMFYIDSSAGDDVAESKEDTAESRYYVGLFQKSYPDRFWASPLVVEGAVRSMRRFLQEYGRWPFNSAATSLERALCYTHRKYSVKKCVTDDEIEFFRQGMADICPDHYPSCERDLQFVSRCNQLIDFCQKYHHLPHHQEQPRLITWYKAQCSQAGSFRGFRKYMFSQTQETIAKLCEPLPPIQPMELPQRGEQKQEEEQLLFDFLGD